MAFNAPIWFLMSRAVAQRQGVSVAEANRLAFLGTVIKPPVIGLVLASTIASRETSSRTVATEVVPSLVGLDKEQAERAAHSVGLEIAVEGEVHKGTVDWQQPKEGHTLPQDHIVKVKLK